MFVRILYKKMGTKGKRKTPKDETRIWINNVIIVIEYSISSVKCFLLRFFSVFPSLKLSYEKQGNCSAWPKCFWV